MRTIHSLVSLAIVLMTCCASINAEALGEEPSRTTDFTDPTPAERETHFPPPESKGGWRKLDTPEDIRRLAGMDPDKLAELKEWLLKSDQRDFAAVVIRNGYVVLEVERGNSAKSDSRRVASVSKAICATVLAIASQQSQQGTLPKRMSFDDPAFDFIPWAKPLSDPRKTKITVEQLLNHTSGICPEATGARNRGPWEHVLGHDGDPLTAKLAFDPGTKCGYSTFAFYHAALVCETVTGTPYDRFAVEALFEPIGCEHWWFQYFDGGQAIGRHPSHSMGMPARDLARVAYCMLHGGRWQDQQVIPQWFVNETAAATHDVQGDEMRFKRNAQSFSHGWELPALLSTESIKGIPRDARYKPGSGGQLMAFVPSLDLVITRQTGASGQWEYQEYLRRACAAVSDPVASARAADRPPSQPLPGQVVVDPERPQWLKRHGGKHVFICGPGDPEDFLYVGKRNPDGTRDGDQLRRIQKLIEHGGNCVYMQAVRSHGGDAKTDNTQNPFVDSDPAQGIDEDILNQWEEWFALMDRNQILIYLFLYDDGARIWDTGDRVGRDEQTFIETIVGKFKHHRNVIWVVGEESEERYTSARVQAIAAVIQNADEHGHLIGAHHLSGTKFKAWQPDGALSHFAMQLSETDDKAHAGAITALRKAAGRYQVIYSESTAMRADVDGMRRHAWSVAMAGMMPMLLHMDIASTPVESLQQCRHLQRFFETTDFWTMTSHDEFAHDGTKYLLADAGRSYIAYADEAGRPLGIKNLPAGRYSISWLDCQTGRTAATEAMIDDPGDHSFNRPEHFGAECAAWIR